MVLKVLYFAVAAITRTESAFGPEKYRELLREKQPEEKPLSDATAAAGRRDDITTSL